MENTDINITQLITETINNLFSNLFSSIDNNLYPFLDDIVFIDSSILEDSYFEKILGTSGSNGILLIANSLLIAILLYYSIRFFLSLYISSPTQKPYQFLLKLVIFAILMNSSYFICEQFININNLISSALRNIGENLFQKSICFSSLITDLNSTLILNGSTLNIFSLDGILKSFTSLGLLNLVFSYSLRYILIKIFILISPFAFLSLSLDTTTWFFKSWLRSFFSLLLLQSFISLLLLLLSSFTFSSDLFSKLVYVGIIYALIKSNSYMKEFFGGISTEINSNLSNVLSLIK